MKNGVCPKCEGNDVYTSRGSTVHYGERSNVLISAFTVLKTEIYICSDCGYIEEYIETNKNSEKLKSKWKKV